MEPGGLFEKFCLDLRHVKGKWAGSPFVLESWQREDMAELLRRDSDGRRVYREGLLMVARKNGKSALASALALYFLVIEGALFDPGAEVYCLAASRQQARIIFDTARKMVDSSPLLRDWIKPYRDTLVVPDTQAVFRVLASDSWNVHGLSPSVYIGDELHAWRDAELWHAMATAGLAREDPLGFGISHAGYTKDSLLGELYQRGQSGQPGFFFKSYEVPRERLEDVSAWKLANPSSWITEEVLEREAMRHPRSIFYRFHCNAWVRAEDLWLPPGAWAECESDLTIEEGDPVYIGVDLGVRHDSSAVVEVAEKDGRYIARARIFQTHPDPSKPEPLAHEVIEGDRIDIALVENAVREIAGRQEVMGVVYDPWRFQRSAELLSDEGLPMIEHPMSNERMAPASQGLFDAIINTKLAHDGDKAFAAHVESAAAKDTERGWRLAKNKSKAPMDASIALAIALSVAQTEGGRGDAAYIRWFDAA